MLSLFHGSSLARERRVMISSQEFTALQAQLDPAHWPVFKIRRCFLWNDMYFQLDMYKTPCPVACEGLCILELYTAKSVFA